MPKQNRVTPAGEIIATPYRGTVMGNRGRLHDEGEKILRPFAVKRWIICKLEFNGRHRQVMAPNRYTELFFLDEAVALAAGHRPCAECNRARYNQFRELWARANPQASLNWGGQGLPTANELDNILHRERLTSNREKVVYRAELAELPDGVFVRFPGETTPYLVAGAELRPWTPAGYEKAVPRPAGVTVEVLTPASTVRTITAGYRPGIYLK
ncbi:MAG: hypothetical protein J0I20_09265 [Chloroflexi bacterium]|nr:hypothetical protein [Chloroflexota bacterium]OJV94698.1 MAG: hypothetical protein BGO39_23550 [Chloroflexi bacterium 54-19]